MKGTNDTPSKAASTKIFENSASLIETIIASYLYKLIQTSNPPPPKEPAHELVFCGNYHKNHPTSQCPVLRPKYPNQGHEMKEIVIIIDSALHSNMLQVMMLHAPSLLH